MSREIPPQMRLEERAPRTGAIAEPSLSVWAIRSWLDGACAQAEVWNLFASRLGAKNGFKATRALEALLSALLACARQPLQRLPSGCRCLTNDERTLVRLIEAAGRDDHESARAEAAMIFPSDAIEPIVAEAQAFGALLHRLDERPYGGRQVQAALDGSATVH